MRACLIAYDVGETATRNALAKKLELAGRRIQKSVYIVRLAPQALENLAQDLQELIEPSDLLLILPLCARCLAKGQFFGPLPPEILIT